MGRMKELLMETNIEPVEQPDQDMEEMDRYNIVVAAADIVTESNEMLAVLLKHINKAEKRAGRE